MSEIPRGEMLALVSRLAELTPDDIRFGQMLANIGLLVDDRTERGLWEVEDDELREIVESHCRDLARLRQPVG